MITVDQAHDLVMESLAPACKRSLSIGNLDREYLREAISADRAYPPFDRVAMDGIAIWSEMYQSGVRRFPLQSCQGAGEPAHQLRDQRHCIEVMTGAPLPHGCDTVIPFESLIEDGNVRQVHPETTVRRGQNIHKEGSDYQKGQRLIEAGVPLSSRHWTVLASVGVSEVQVSKRPRLALVSTGDELVAVEDSPEPYQIRMSNSWSMKASLATHGYREADIFHLPDEGERLNKQLSEIMASYDHLILSGGVSKGRYDFVPQVLEDLGVQKIFHRIAQKPGKPMWFGRSPTGQGVFGLPGNPNSALICLHRYVIPALNRTLSPEPPPNLLAVLEADVSFTHNLTLFQPVRINVRDDGSLGAVPLKTNGSGDFAALVPSDGFLELPRGQSLFQKGQVFPLILWDGGLG